jgi:hypothetical protein
MHSTSCTAIRHVNTGPALVKTRASATTGAWTSFVLTRRVRVAIIRMESACQAQPAAIRVHVKPDGEEKRVMIRTLTAHLKSLWMS